MKYAVSAVVFFAALYLAGDFLVFNGPANRWLRPPSKDLVALVANQPITRRQVERAVNEQLWLEGKSVASLSPAAVAMARKAALEELIDHELLRLKVASAKPTILVVDAEVDDRLRRLVGRFETKGTLETAMKTQGIPDEKSLRDRIAARIREEKWLAQQILPATQVSDEEAREWFEKNPLASTFPNRVEARHIFIPTLNRPSDEAKRKLDETLVTLTEKKKDFATLAKEVSEDPATKDNGGGLGWMTADRLPADFAVPVFALSVNQPDIIRTKLGWHLVEVTARKPAESRSFDQAKPEMIAALHAVKTREATQVFKASLRTSSADQIRIFDW